MSVLVECVPNFSEGSNPKTLNAIRAAIEAISGVQVLDVDPGVAANRTVFTFVGNPTAVEEAAVCAIRVAGEHIDMSTHSGEHPRMGATDVCPFVPVQGIGLQELRKGEYEALQAKMIDPKWAPDFGGEWSDSVAKTGATVIGARPFLIAWNINLNTNNQRKAEKIAATIRDKGAYVRDANGELMRGDDGKPFRSSGLFRHVNAIGWTIDEYGHCQISCNVLDCTQTGLHTIYDAGMILMSVQCGLNS